MYGCVVQCAIVRCDVNSCAMCLLSGQFGGENGEQCVAACSEFCRDQWLAHEVLKVHCREDPKLAMFLQVMLV